MEDYKNGWSHTIKGCVDSQNLKKPKLEKYVFVYKLINSDPSRWEAYQVKVHKGRKTTPVTSVSIGNSFLT